MNNTQRHLAAILFTDIVGYTAMMQENESKAVAAMKRHNHALERLAGVYHGRVANYFGDGSLCIFQSSTEAVQCAIEIQKELQKEPIVPLRIGLHIGEVFFEDDKAIGDGVNIASRIQSLGQANTILLSREIVDKIRNHPEFKPVSLGSFEFKNVNEPLEVFALANEGLSVPKRNTIQGKLKAPPAENNGRKIAVFITSLVLVSLLSFFLIKKFSSGARSHGIEKSIAVLPFANMSNDKDQEYFSEGITDDILDHLAKISDLKVKSRTSTLRYRGSIKTMTEIGEELGVGALLEGSVRKSGNTVRIVVQLIDTKTDDHLFSQTYDREIKDVLATQSEIAIEIANALQAKLSPQEKQNISKAQSTDITAYDYYLKAREILFKPSFDRAESERGKQFLRNAIDLDSNFAGAYALLGVFYNNEKWFGMPASIWLDSSSLLIEKAIRIDPNLPDGYIARIFILNEAGNSMAAESDLKKVYSIAPNNGMVLDLLAQNFNSKGEYYRAANLELKSIDILFNKKEPQYFIAVGYLYYMMKEFPTAEKMFRQAASLDPESTQPLQLLAYCYYDQKLYAQAAAYYEQILKKNPKIYFAVDALAWCSYFMGNMDKAEELWSSYKQIEAGFPDSTQFVAFRHRLAYIKWKKNEKEVAKKLFAEQLKLDHEGITRKRKIGVWEDGGLAYDYAAVNSFLGNKELAFQWLDSSLAKNFYLKWLVEADPLLNNIRSEKRFKEWLAKANKIYNEEERITGYQRAMKEYENGKFRNNLENTRLN